MYVISYARSGWGILCGGGGGGGDCCGDCGCGDCGGGCGGGGGVKGSQFVLCIRP